jgi:hypothetical protein
MKMVSMPGQGDFLVLALGGEEAAILLRPAARFRALLDQNRVWRAAARFLAPADRGAAQGLLAIVPRPAASALLTAVAEHPVERELQGLLFAALIPAERPPWQP